jgi:hypothetical protein
MSSDSENAVRTIAKIAGVNVSQLPPLTPEDFRVSDWRWLEHATGQDIRDSLCDVWHKMGAKIVCPRCHSYATQVFFDGRFDKIPKIFWCGYERYLWHDGASDRRVRQVAADMHFKMEQHDEEDRQNGKSKSAARTYR